VAGHRDFRAIAVACDDVARTGSPCGGCRQFLAEFAPDMPVIYRRDGDLVAETVRELLPATFVLETEG
jgi:cytidine deaminase